MLSESPTRVSGTKAPVPPRVHTSRKLEWKRSTRDSSHALQDGMWASRAAA